MGRKLRNSQDRDGEYIVLKQQPVILEKVFESLPYPFYVIDAQDYTIRMANLAAGYHELSGPTTCYTLTHKRQTPCNQTDHPCPLVEVKRTGQPVRMEHIHFDAQGNVRHVEVHGFPIMDSSGELVQMIEWCLDITERKRLEEELKKIKAHLEELVRQRTAELQEEIVVRRLSETNLRESEERYRKTVDAAPYSITITRAIDGRYLQVNDFFVQITGYRPEEVLGRTPMELDLLVDPQDRDRFLKIVADKGEVDSFELQYRGKGGQVIDALLSARPLRIGGEDCLLAVVTDITEKKKTLREREGLEKQLQQALKMEALGTLAGGIAHDFNNILAIILGNAEMALCESPTDSKLKFSLDQIIEAGGHAKELVKQILNFSRQSRKELRPVKTSPIIKEALKLIRASLPSTIEIHQKIFCEKDIVLSDPTQIYQILMNLCTNSLHALRNQGGILNIELTNTILAEADLRDWPQLKAGSYLKLLVQDTGRGMSPEVLERIFDPYYTTKEKGVGTGLGLAVVQTIVQEHGGAIQVRSTEGRGTTAVILVPIIEKGAAPYLAPLESPLGRDESVLFIDDEEWIVDLGVRMLQHLGYRVTGKTSSLGALDLFRGNPQSFDLVISDMTMPQMTGDKLAEELLRLRADLPIILMTGFSDLINEAQAREKGIRALVYKPLAMNQIAVLIRQILDQSDEKTVGLPGH
jgi:PAS domain S-box-containing protein